MQAMIKRFFAVLLLVPLLASADYPIMPDKAELLETTCVRVVDGDTAWFEETSGLVVHKVRFIGIDTPETVHPTKPIQPYGPEASAFTSSMLLDQAVWLEYDIQPHDHYDRHLCYIWLADGTLFNLLLVEQGYATESPYKPNLKYKEFFEEAERFAMNSELGLWASR